MGVGWKNFLPAKWEREMGHVFTARTGIVIKQPGRAYRSPMNAPDETERAALVHFVKAARDDNRPRTTTEQWGKQAVYRHMEPIRLLSPCPPCHGKPKGTGLWFPRRTAWRWGDVIGSTSASFAVGE